jgi:16S rRNA (cytidine1402-2'-O)-methyltransferase
MTNKGKLFLIPNVIADDTVHRVTTPQLLEILPGIRHFVVENVRTARRYLSALKIYDSIENLNFSVLDKDTKSEEVAVLLSPLAQGFNVGIISESGCPGIADPGALAVQYAHRQQIRVIPLVGPSSILLALMASGLNGQKFSFQGYLPINNADATAAVKAFERESKTQSQTQIFIETPYRNNSIAKILIQNLKPTSLLTIAIDITGPQENILTKSVQEWKSKTIELPKSPAVFLFLAQP